MWPMPWSPVTKVAAYGVTTVVSLGANPDDELEQIKLRDEQNSTVLDRARVYTSGGSVRRFKTPEEARKDVNRVADLHSEITEWRRDIHAHPELMYDVERTAATVAGKLKSFGCDEVVTGIGRTGAWFFAGGEAAGGVVPDIITLAKALGSGVPVGACLLSESIASHIKENDLGTTFGGGPLACATALEFLNIIEDEKLLENIRERGAELREGLSALAAKFPFIREIRGDG